MLLLLVSDYERPVGLGRLMQRDSIDVWLKLVEADSNGLGLY